MQVLVSLQALLEVMKSYFGHRAVEGQVRRIMFPKKTHAVMVTQRGDRVVNNPFSMFVFQKLSTWRSRDVPSVVV